MRRPYLVNDVNAQDILLDRRKVYRKLKVCFWADRHWTEGGG